jgi:hypothetical protein
LSAAATGLRPTPEPVILTITLTVIPAKAGIQRLSLWPDASKALDPSFRWDDGEGITALV